MTEWRPVSIEDLCIKVTSGGTPSRKRPEFYAESAEGIPWVKSQELTDCRIRATSEAISKEGLEKSSAKLLPCDTVLMAMYGATVGQLGYLDIEATVNQAICGMIVDPDMADSRYLYYGLMHARPELVAQAQGAAQQNLSQAVIRPFRLHVPSVGVQSRIAAVLGSIDDLIDNNRRRVEVLEEMARAIYREWFVHFRFPGHEDATFVDSDLGPIPDGWDVVPLGELVVRRKATVGPDEADPSSPLVGLEHIPRRQLTLDDWAIAEDVGSRKTIFECGDVLFSKIRPYFHKVAVAPVGGVCSTDALVFAPVKPHRGQAIMALSSDELIAHATQTANGTKMPRANWDVLAAMPAVVPPEAVADQFSCVIDDLLSTCMRLMLASRTLADTRDLLLPKLVTGQLDVSDLDLDAVVERAGV